MILCLCNGVNQRTIRDLIRKNKLRTAKSVYKSIGKVQCGKCKDEILWYIEKDRRNML